MPVPQIATRTRRALHLLLMGAALTLITVVTSATTAATAKGTKSRSKIIVVKAKKYLLTVDGRFSLTSGDIIDDGTISVPVIPIETIKVPGQPVLQMGTGN